MTAKPLVEIDRVAAFLAARHGTEIVGLEQLSGGWWSSAFGYRADGRDLVVRFGRDREWYEVDQRAHAYSSPDLPVPQVVSIGEAFDEFVFAVSERAYGQFLEDLPPTDDTRETVGRLLRGLRSAPDEDAPYTWREWLEGGLAHDGRNAEWRARVAADPHAGPVADAAEERVRQLLDACPERRDLVHGDLVHRNVLVATDAPRINAVFSWKCSARGDALFDVAWLTFWGEWFPGIKHADAWALVADTTVDAALRHHCYELHIGATHLCWYAQVDDVASLRRVAAQLSALLERGPR